MKRNFLELAIHKGATTGLKDSGFYFFEESAFSLKEEPYFLVDLLLSIWLKVKIFHLNSEGTCCE